MHDLLIRGGTVLDGTGAPARVADVAIDGETIAAVGADLGPARRTLDADGLLVTPGWVDIHTHYDAQVTWDPWLTPSGWHGGTTVVMGNCGVGFAPARAAQRDWVIGLMEGVEDIPGAAIHCGLQWGWETFPEYLDDLAGRRCAMDFAAQIPHGPLRVYVMGERGAKNQEATTEDIANMAGIVGEAMRAGALGFSTSRTLIHRGSDGVHVPGTWAAEDELFGIGRAMAAAGGGVFQMTSNHVDMADEFVWMRRMARELGLSVSFNLLQTDEAPRLWERMLGLLDEAAAEGLPLRAQVAARPSGVLMCLEGTAVPFLNRIPYLEIHQLPWPERLARLRDPEVRRRILAAEPISIGPFEDFILGSYHKMFRLGDPPDYEPLPSASAAAIAAATGRQPAEVVYDWVMELDGRGVVYFPIFNYSDGDMDHLRRLMTHPRTAMGLADGGAHCGAICDVSMPTYLLTHWARDRARGPRLPLEEVVRMQTSETADFYGLVDRGRLLPGKLADVNLIDFQGMRLAAPEMIYDLPAGGRRFVQRASGYEATIKRGVVVALEGEKTGALPGRLLRRGYR